MLDLMREGEEREAAAIVGFSEAREMGFGVYQIQMQMQMY